MGISVTVKTLDSQNHQFEGLDDDITVQAFKEHIASTVNVPADRQRLIYCGRVLKDDKKLSEYEANGKVIHLVQRNPNIPQDGPDNLSASEARARGASPARSRAHHHHIHIQQQPGYIPSMTFRLNIARELLTRANRIVARLENPSAPPPPPPPPLEPAENAENSNFAPQDPSQMGALPAQVAQVFQSAVNSAMQSMRGGNLQQGHIEMSVSIDQNGQIISQSSSSDNSSSTAAATSATTTPTSTATATSAASTSAPSAGSGPGTPRSASGRQLQHPPLSELADAMDELQRTEDRFRPFRQRMYDILRSDPAFESDQGRIEAQQLFNRSTEVMHLLSHVQHALSDAVVNMNQDRPRHIRASPLVIQSRSTFVQSVPMGSNMAASGAGRGTSQEQTGRPTSNEASAANAASPTATADAPRNIGEVEVNVEPIIVGIEMDSDGSRASSSNPQAAPAFMQGLMQMLNGSGGGTGRGGVGLHRAAQSATRSSSTNTSTPGSGGQGVGGGAQTQSTTSTNTRSSAHVHVAPLGPMSFNFPPMMMSQPSFDPLLPCNSHHTNPLNRRTRHPAGPQAPQRPRSASVPPRNAANRAQQEARSNHHGGEANSARSSPAHVRRPPSQRSNFDFEITAHADIMPMIMTPQGMVSIGTPTRMQQPSSRATVSSGGSGSLGGQDRMEPSLAQLLAALQGEAASGGDRVGGSGNVDLGMLNVVMGVMNEINGNSNRTVSEFLERIPDYNYREGESLVTDLLMLIARNTSFADLVNILQGSSDLNHLQTPLREFIRRYILTPPNEDEEHDIDAAVLYLVDSHFTHLEAMAAEANVQADIDFAETVHSFLTANLSSLAEAILKTPSGNFGPLFRQRSVSFLARLTTLCLRCFTDGHASLERVIRNRIEAISGDYGATLRDFVLSAAVAHFRNYLASLEATSAATRLQNDQDVEQYLVRTGPDADQRRAARRRRLTQHQQAREEETFVTPRSSPTRASPTVEPPAPTPQEPPIAMDVDNDPKEIVEPPSQQHSTFPESLSDMGSMESTINVGSQPWHGTLPANWVPIVARDVNRQNGDAIHATGRPLSDALLSTQSAKRRRLASKSKPEGNVEQLIADTLHSAIRVSGAQPVHAVEEVIQETSGHDAVQQSLGQDIQKSLSRRVANDPDFDSKKFPNAAKNLSAKKS